MCRVLDGARASEPNQLAARSTADLQGLERLMDTVHKYGTRMFLQLHHPGREGQLLFGEEPVAASAVPHPLSGLTPRALTVPEIQRIQAAFVTGGAGRPNGGCRWGRIARRPWLP